jgi:phosphoglycerate kinase
MRSINKLKNLKGKTVLLRVDFNVPIEDGKVVDDFKIRKAIPTIKFLQKHGAKIILVTHLGRGGETLLPLVKVLNKFIKADFVPDLVGEEAQKAVAHMKNKSVLLLENLRGHKGEKSCDKEFAKSLAKFADIYVNEAFPVSHRKDASIVLLPKLLPAYAGFQLQEEVKNLSVALKPKHPFLFILGGAKFETKLPILEKYLKTADYLFVGGAMLNDFLKVKGFEVGKSLVSEKNYGINKIYKNKKLIIPENIVVETKDGKFFKKKASEVSASDSIIDLGSMSVEAIKPYIKKAKLIVWNGPLGKFESNRDGSTKDILKLVAASSAFSIVGGGDTVGMIFKMKAEKKFSFVSTGGGATLDFLASGTLPGIKALG